MLIRLLPLIALATLTSSALAASGTFTRTLTASDHPDIYVSSGSGNIRIHPGSGTQVEIVGHVHASWGATGNVQARIDRIVSDPPITQSGDAIHIGESNDRSLFNNISVDYEVSVPANAALNLRSGSGDVEAESVGRFLAASSGSGSVRGHGIHGPAELETGSGDIELEDTAPGNVKTRTGSGSIRVHGIDGNFQARTGSGDIEADGHLTGASSLATGSGSVRLHLAASSRFNLEAATGSGSIRVNFPGYTQGNDTGSRHHLTTSINGGGDPIAIRTGSGDIELSAR
ncbi:MAG: DUF4097 family beta strand repeat-containing protein [Acidobacteriaceae bacterium]|nr:DUF4097 family beta strand repeat-containing protein [Acidobacteriaceae bacterium]